MKKTDIKADSVLALITARPGLRTVQLSDQLDMEFSDVEEALADLVIAKKIARHETVGPNNRKAWAWTLFGQDLPAVSETSTQAAKAQQHEDGLLTPHQVTRPAAGTPIHIPGAVWPGSAPKAAPVEASKPAEAPRPAKPVKPSKPAKPVLVSANRPGALAVRAIAYLRHHATATNDEMQRVLGIAYAPLSALKRATKEEWVTYQDLTWTLGGKSVELTASDLSTAAEPVAAAVAEVSTAPVTSPKQQDATAVATTDAVNSPAHYTAGGLQVIDVLRAKLSPEEYKGFLKGNIVKYTLRAELKGGAQDYQKAAVYSRWLVEATAGQGAYPHRG